MKWVKQSIHYWCPDTQEHKFLGQNVTAAILDTGISPHPDFKGRILSFRDFSSTLVLPKSSFFFLSFFAADRQQWHGTHVAGILAGSGLLSSGRLSPELPPSVILLLGKY